MSKSDEREPFIGIYRRQNGPTPRHEMHDVEDAIFDLSDSGERHTTNQVIGQYLERRGRQIKRFVEGRNEAVDKSRMREGKKKALRECTTNLNWDAETTLEQISAIAAMLVPPEGAPTASDFERIFIEAIKLGRSIERVYVRRYEHWAMIGRECGKPKRASVLTDDEWDLVCAAVEKFLKLKKPNGEPRYTLSEARDEVALKVRGGTFADIAGAKNIGGEMLRKRFRAYRKARQEADD